MINKLPDNALYYYVYLLTKKEEYEIDFKLLNKLVRPDSVNYKNEYGDTPLHEVVLISKFVIKIRMLNRFSTLVTSSPLTFSTRRRIR